jgi:2-polyprenyl-3-methyl-5-hydroxy-6-metoxy-1,4-benzoquinol methylase
MEKNCPICSSIAVLRISDMNGYVEGTKFGVFECSFCHVAFTDPVANDFKIYDLFYKNADVVPGYERYQRYAALARITNNPLKALTSAEAMYWGAIEAIRQKFSDRKDITIAEVGSGLGYLVNGLRQAGYDATGVDISKDANDKATEYFGPYFHTDDLFHFAEIHQGKYDCVIMLETIEHVDDPNAFIVAGLKLLKKDGILVLTTPNKERFTAAPWSIDPPVHFWSFTEKSINVIAEKLNKRVSFIDFTEFTKKFFNHTWHHVSSECVELPYRITKEYTLKEHFKTSKLKTHLLSVRGRHLLSVLRRRLKKKDVSSKLPTLCAVIHNS